MPASLESRRQRYHADAEYRARTLRRIAAYRLRRVQDPRWRALVKLRKQITADRAAVATHERKAAYILRRLMKRIERRDRLALELRKRK